MTSYIPQARLSVDPLIGEARARTHRRRFRVTAAFLLIATAGAIGTAIAIHPSRSTGHPPRITGAIGPQAAIQPFAGTWGGHGKGLVISSSGYGTETVGIPAPGNKARFLRVHFRITNVWASNRWPLASVVFTGVHLPFPNMRYYRIGSWSAPRVGQKGTLRIVHGVLHSALGDLFCNGKTPDPQACGA